MTERERRKRRRKIRQRRRQAAAFVVLFAALVSIVSLRAGYKRMEDKQETTREQISATEHTRTITTALPEASEKISVATPTPAIEPESRYDALEISEDDIQTLACLVYHEARGEPFKGQVAVIEVVLNRMLSPQFPDTVEEVVFQKYGKVWQFSPAPYLWTAEPGEMQYEAVETALHSAENVLPVEAVFFSGAPYNDKIVDIIGGHYFCTT